MQDFSAMRAYRARVGLSVPIIAVMLIAFLIALPTTTTAQTGPSGNGRVLAGYWHDWETPVWIPLGKVPLTYDIIVVAFANYNGGGNFSFTVDPAETQSQFISDIQYLHSQGKKVLISLGGAVETPIISSASDASNFASSVESLIKTYGFDGIDIDFENGAVYLNAGDTNINAPTTPSVVYLISALKQFHSAMPNAMVTMAPIANYMQAGYQYYGPGPYGDSNWNGAYLPVIQAISGFLSYVWPQYYNECNIEALDGNLYCEGSDGNLVGMSEMIMKGFPVAWNAGTFTGLAQDQVTMGVPACESASPGYLSNSDLEASLSYLTTGRNQAGTYTLKNASGYPNTAGFMTWSINWDVFCSNGGLGSGIHSYLAGLPPINGHGGGCSAAPSAPTGLEASNTTSSGTTLSWSAVTPPANCSIASYTVLENGSAIATTSSTSYSVTGLSASTKYSFTVEASDSHGTSGASSAVSVTTLPGSGCSASPTAPTGLKAANTTSSGTTLSWSAVTPPANCSIASYAVLENGSAIATTSSTSYSVTGLSASTNYSFTVEASDSHGTSSASSAVSVTTSPGTSGSVTLSPSSHNFGSTPAGTGTAWFTFTLTNSGGSAVSMGSVSVSGPFVVSSNCGSSVAANSSCPIYVYFAPTAAGSFTGTLTVNDSGTQTAALSGTGS